MSDKNMLQIDLGFAVLSAEIDTGADYPAIYIGLCDKAGRPFQDLACVRHGAGTNAAAFEVRTFADKNSEDYTNKIKCEVHRDYYNVFNSETETSLLVLSPSEEHAIELADEYAKKILHETLEWKAEYLTDEDRLNGDIPYNTYTCSYVIQDELFEKEYGVIFVDEVLEKEDEEERE